MADRLARSRDRASRKRRKFIVTVLLGSVAAAAQGAAVTLDWPMASIDGANSDDLKQVAMGQSVYQQSCASCHGANLEGQPDWRVRKPDGRLPAPPHDETGHTWHHGDDHLFRITKRGVRPPLAPAGYESDMPGFEGVLADSQIRAVLAFIRSTWPPHIRKRQRRFDRASRP